MPHYLLKLNVRGKDGSLRMEEMILDRHASGAIELPRAPQGFERWDGKKWVADEVGKATHIEDARLRRMSPAERHEEAIRTAEAHVAAKLQKLGINLI